MAKAILILVALGLLTGTLKQNLVSVDTAPLTRTKTRLEILPCYAQAFGDRERTHETSKQAKARCIRELKQDDGKSWYEPK